jgi:hypothetical protein
VTLHAAQAELHAGVFRVEPDHCDQRRNQTGGERPPGLRTRGIRYTGRVQDGSFRQIFRGGRRPFRGEVPRS